MRLSSQRGHRCTTWKPQVFGRCVCSYDDWWVRSMVAVAARERELAALAAFFGSDGLMPAVLFLEGEAQGLERRPSGEAASRSRASFSGADEQPDRRGDAAVVCG